MTTLLGVVAALPDEAACLSGQKVRPGQRLRLDQALVQVSGIGDAAARNAAIALTELGVDALLSWGTAGALDPALCSGDLLLPEEVQSASGRFGTDEAWRGQLAGILRERLTVHCGGSLVQSPEVVDSPAAKRRIRQQTGALAVDMESAGVAAVASSRHIPFLVVRSIVDASNAVVPGAALAAVDAYGRVKVPLLLRGLCRRPAEIPQLIHLNRAFRRALATLRLAAETAGPAFGRGP